MLAGLAKRDDVQIVSMLCVGHVDDLLAQQTKDVDSLLAVGDAGVFLGDVKCIHKK
jgi:hypothetical protein